MTVSGYRRTSHLRADSQGDDAEERFRGPAKLHILDSLQGFFLFLKTTRKPLEAFNQRLSCFSYSCIV